MPDQITRLEDTLPFEINPNGVESNAGFRFSIMSWAQPSVDLVPRYWSQHRDNFLRQFYTESDPIKITTATFIHKVSTIPIAVFARDRSVSKHVRQARTLNENLLQNSGLFAGFRFEIEKILGDYLTQDKGCFILIMGAGRGDGPILGPAQGLFHLDAEFCVLTGDPQYPVVYQHEDGNEYKLHYTRVIHLVNSPSAKRGLRGVGLCPLSACLDAARELKDIHIYSQESYGSRPMRRALYAKKGANIEQLKGAVDAADDKMDSEGLTRFAKTLLMAPKNPNSELELETLDLVSVPEGFVRRDVSILDMAFLAAAYGMNLNDLAMAFAEKAGSESSTANDRKGWGKGVALFVDRLVDQLNKKFLPPHLRVVADNVDDAQDKHQAEIRKLRSETRKNDLTSSVTTLRIERERMLEMHEITEEQFEDMELLEGRLPNGLDVFSLFESTDNNLQELLDLGSEDPTLTGKNDAYEMLDKIHEKIKFCWQQIEQSGSADTSRRIRHALAALEKLRAMYQSEIEIIEAMMQEPVGDNVSDPALDPGVATPSEGDEEVINETTRLEAAA